MASSIEVDGDTLSNDRKDQLFRRCAVSYALTGLTIRTDNSEAGMAWVDELWRDVVSGKLPLMHDSEGRFLEGLSPISRYANYESNEHGMFDLTVHAVTAEFFPRMEARVAEGEFARYDVSAASVKNAATEAWSRVARDQETGTICRAFSEDFESTVPAEYTKDGRAHCYLYISVE